jgi:alpha/beta superfamily hydrolase
MHQLRSGLELEVSVWNASTEKPVGIAIIGHPHPLQGGTMNHKVVHILAKTLSQLGYLCYCPNFRGTGRSTGTHDSGTGECEDLLELWEHLHAQYPSCPSIISGFSFGGYVATHVQQSILNQKPEHSCHLVLIGAAIGKYEIDVPTSVPSNTLVIHGEEDEIIPLSNVMTWAQPQQLPVVVIPGAGHFFHGNLLTLQRVIFNFLKGVLNH